MYVFRGGAFPHYVHRDETDFPSPRGRERMNGRGGPDRYVPEAGRLSVGSVMLRSVLRPPDPVIAGVRAASMRGVGSRKEAPSPGEHAIKANVRSHP